MNQDRKLLIAGGSHSDIPLIRAGKKLGFHVITSGNRSRDLGHAYSDEFHPADYSDLDAVCQLAADLEVEAICACCNDFSAISCSYTAEKLGLPGHDSLATAKTIHHKHLWRKFALEKDIPTPRARGCNTLLSAEAALETIDSPWMIKPVDLTGGKGIAKAYTREEARPAIKEALASSKAGHIVIEEFIEGTRHGFSAMLRKGKIVFHFSDDEHYHLSEYLVSGATTPSSSSPAIGEELVRISERVASLLGLVDGIFHVQYIERNEEPVIIEICRRAPGDLYVDLVQTAAGVPYAEWIVRAAAGLPLDEIRHTPPGRSVTRHCIMGSEPGIYRGLEVSPRLGTRVLEQLVWAKPGDVITDAATQKFGIIFVEHENESQRRKDVPNLNQLIRPVVDSDQG